MTGFGRDHLEQMLARQGTPIEAGEYRSELRVVERRELIDERTRAWPDRRAEDLDDVHEVNNNRAHRQFTGLWTTASGMH